MARTAILAIKVISDATKAAAGLDSTGKSTSKLEQRMGKATKVAKGVALGLGAIGGAALKQASDLQQASGAVDSVFGKNAGKIHGLAKEAADSVGLARSEYSQLAAVLGSQLNNLGVSQDQIVGKTDGLIKKGGDLAATFGGTTAEAVSALGALLRGEADPIERYGVSIKDADIKAQLAAKGQDKLTGAQAKAAKTQAILELLNKQTAKASGQRAREAGSEAQAREVALAKLKNAGASLGTVLLPIVAAIAAALGRMAGVVENNRRGFTILLGVLAGLTAAVFAVNGAIAAYTAISKIARAAVIVFRNAQMALNLAMRLNPVGLVVTAILLLVGGLILAYKKSKTFRAIVDAVMRAAGKAIKAVIKFVSDLVKWVKDNAPAAWNRLKSAAVTALRILTLPIRTAIRVVTSLVQWVRDKVPAGFRRAREIAVDAFRAITAPIRTAIGYVRDLINWIKKIKIPSLGGIGRAVGGVFGFASRTTASPASSLLSSSSSSPTARSLVAGGSTARSLLSSSSSRRSSTDGEGTVNIYVEGALDPDAVAKQIEKLLGRRRTRIRGAGA